MTVRSRRLALAVGVLVLVLLAIPFAFPRAGLEVWRTYTRLRFGARSAEIVVDGRRIAIATIGEGEPLVLLHGLRGESTVLMPLARELARSGRRVVMVDLPGHGRSDPPLAPLDIESAGAVLMRVIDQLDLGPRPAIAGHSIGAWVVAWQALAEPERVGPIVLISTPGLAFDPPPYPQLMPHTAEDARLSLPLLFADPPYVPRPILWVSARRPHGPSLDLLRSAMSGRYLLDGLFEGLSMPALILCGTDDRLVPASVGEQLAALSPRARYVGVPEASHLVVWEKPVELAREIDAFLDHATASAP